MAFQSMKQQKTEQEKQVKLSEKSICEQAMQKAVQLQDNQELNESVAALGKQIKENEALLFNKTGKTDVKEYHAPGEDAAGVYDNWQPQEEKHLKRQQERKQHFKEAQQEALKKLDRQMNELEDNAWEKAQEGQKLEQEHYQQRTLTNMMASITLSTEVPMEQREALMDSVIALRTQAKALFKRFAKAETVLKMKHIPSGLKKICQNRLKKIKVEQEALDQQVDQFYQNQYQQSIPFLTTTTGHGERFLERSKTYAQVKNCKLKEAFKAIMKRSAVPATLEKHQENRETWLKTETGDFSYKVKNNKIMDAVISHKDMMADLMKFLKSNPKYEKFTEEEVETATEEYLKRALEDSDFRFRCSADNFDLIVQDKMKSQMEVGRSAATYNPEQRMRYASRHFGVEMNSIDATEYENYGYLASKDIAEQNNQSISEHPTDGYGELAVKLNRERMKGRVTMTVGDSLQGFDSAIPELVDHPTINCIGAGFRALIATEALDAKLDQEKAKKPIKVDSLLSGNFSYFELQYHGDVTARDIEELTLVVPMKLTKPGTDPQKIIEIKEKIIRVRKKVEEINLNPEKYGRTKDMEPIAFRVLDCDHKLHEPSGYK